MSKASRPIVYISYSWIDTTDQTGRRVRAPDPRGLELAEILRAAGVDVRLDLYFLEGKHGFRPPQKEANNPLDPWLIWSTKQIDEADAVVMLCVPGYASSDPDRGETPGTWSNWTLIDEQIRIKDSLNREKRVPALWWDWLAIARQSSARPEKFIPVGYGPYDSELVPGFIRGTSYCNLGADGASDTLLRRIRQLFHDSHPRKGIFVSYAHADDQRWLDMLMTHLKWLTKQGDIEIWTDQDILPGDKWHESIQIALNNASVAVLMVSPGFLASEYIGSQELPQLLRAAESEGLRIFWIPVRPSAYKQSPISAFQAAHTPDKPLSTLSEAERDQALVDIGQKLARVLNA